MSSDRQSAVEEFIVWKISGKVVTVVISIIILDIFSRALNIFSCFLTCNILRVGFLEGTHSQDLLCELCFTRNKKRRAKFLVNERGLSKVFFPVHSKCHLLPSILDAGVNFFSLFFCILL